MKCIINCSSDTAKWVGEFFPQVHPYMLKIANKPLLEYYIDFCSLLGVRHLRLITTESDPGIENYFQDGSQWDMDISYGFVRPEDEVDAIIEKNRSFIGASSLMFIDDYIFLRYDKLVNYRQTLRRSSSWKLVGDDGGGLRFIHSSDMDSKVKELELEQYLTGRVDLVMINSIKKFYHINMIMLYESATNYILPCYNNEEGFYIGHNVSIDRHCALKKPTMLGNNIQLEDFCTIGPGAVIGSNVMISSGTTVENSIIYEYSYLGEHLEFKNKIVNKNLVINPMTEESIELVDDFLLSELNTAFFSASIKRNRSRIVAFILYLCMLPLYLLGRLFLGVKAYKRDYYRDLMKQQIPLTIFAPGGNGMRPRIFFKLSLDKVPLLAAAFMGRIHLVGNSPCPAKEEYQDILIDMPWYHPAVFSYSEMLGHGHYDDFEHSIHELYYCHHATLWLNLKVLVKFLMGRIFNPTWPLPGAKELEESEEK